MKLLLVVLSLLFTTNAFSEVLARLSIPKVGISFSSELEEISMFVKNELSDPRSDFSEYVDEYGEIDPDIILRMLRKISEHAVFSQGIFTKVTGYSLPIMSRGKIVTEVFITLIEDESKNFFTIIIEDRATVRTSY